MYTIVQDLLDDDYEPADYYTPLLSALRYFQNNENIIPLFKILNLRPLVRDLNGSMNLSEDKVIKQVARALGVQLTAKAPSDQLDDYKKLALAVFPKEIAGRLRAAGFYPVPSKFKTLVGGRTVFY